MTKRVAVVTGASKGIGLAIADKLAQKGYLVYGTSRTQLPDRKGVRMRVLQVTDEESVRSCISGILAETGGCIDVLVNNAAIAHVSPAEEHPLDSGMEMMNVNYWGSVRVTNAVLPSMRKRRSGRIIFISSLAGLMGIPGQSFYCGTKHAMEAYADSLYLELGKFDIKVTILEPGSYKTGILDHTAQPTSWAKFNDYEEMRKKLPKTIREKTQTEGQNPQLVADLVVQVASSNNPRLRTAVSPSDKRAVIFKTFLPEKMFYKTIGEMFGL